MLYLFALTTSNLCCDCYMALELTIVIICFANAYVACSMHTCSLLTAKQCAEKFVDSMLMHTKPVNK